MAQISDYSILDHVLEGCQIIGYDWRYLFFNDAAAKHNRRPKEEMLGRKFMDMWPGIETTEVYLIIKRCLEDRIANYLDYEFVFPDGTIAWFSLSIQPVPEGVFILSIDISDRKRAEETLRNAETRYRVLFEQSPSGVVLMDIGTGETIEVNETAPRQLGYTREEFAALKISDYEALEKPEETEEHFQKVIREGSADFETLHRTKSGEIRHVHVWAKTLQVSGRSLMYSVFQDITERMRAEEELRQYTERLEQAEKRASLGSWEYDAGSGQGWWSKQMYELLGFQESNNVPDLAEYLAHIHPEDRTIVQDVFVKMANGEEPPPQEFRSSPEFGPIRYFVPTVALVRNAAGEPQKFIGTMHDVTQYKEAEEKIRKQTARAEALVRTAARLNSELELDGVLNSVCEETARAFNVPAVAINLIDKATQTIVIAADYGLPPYYRQRQKPIALTTFAAIQEIKTDGVVIIPDVQAIPDLPDADLHREINTRTVVGIGLVREGVIIGGLNLITFGEVRQFSDDELALLQGLAHQAAQAITNAQLYAVSKLAQERIISQLQRLESLRSIDTAIANSFDVRLTLKVLVESTVLRLGVDAAAVLLYKPANNMLEFAVGQGFRTKLMEKGSLQLGKGLAGRAALERQSVYVPNLMQLKEELIRAPLFIGEDFIAYYGVPLIAKGQIKGVLEIFHRTPLNPEDDWVDYLETLAGQAAIAIDSAQAFDGLLRSNINLSLAYDATIEGWSRAMDLRDKETEGHTQRVTKLTMQLARAMDMSEEQIIHVRRGALLHDMGKLGIPDEILLKPGKLTDEEWVIMRQHPQFAFDMLSSIEYLHPALDIPYCHHEKWDGSGYPRGLKGEQIPLAARLFAIVDVWDALTSDRPYRKAWSQEKTLEYIRSLAGTHFAPQAVELFLRVFNEMPEEFLATG